MALTGGVASMPTTSYGSTPNGLIETRALDGNSVELNEHVEPVSQERPWMAW